MRLALSLSKPRYHLSFAAVIVAAFLFASRLDEHVALRLAGLFASFNVLFYSGIYILNDVADVRVDAAHPGKRSRPIPSGQISIRKAILVATLLVAGGLLTAALLFPPAVVMAYISTLALNLAYSTGGRNIPYLDIALNSAPHALRFLMGALLVGRVPPAGHLLSWFCLAAGIACIRRLVELETDGTRSRPVLRHYSQPGLSRVADAGILLVLGFFLLDRLQSPGFYAIALTSYVLFVLSARRLATGRNGLVWLWLR